MASRIVRRRTRLGLTLIAGVFLVPFVGCDTAIVTGSQGELEVQPSELSLGDVWASRQLRHVVNVRNRSASQDVEVLRIDTSCGCTSVRPAGFTVPAGGSVPVEVLLDVRRPTGHMPIGRQPFSVELSPQVRVGMAQRDHWKITADVLEPVVWNAEDARLPAIRASEIGRELFVPISIAEGIALTVATDLPHASARLASSQDGGAAIGVLLRDSCPVGEFRLSIDLRPVATEGAELTIEPLEVRGELIADVSVEPRELVFDSIPVGDSRTRSLVFAAASGQGAFSVERLEVDGEEVSVVARLPSSGRRIEYDVTCAPTFHGSRKGAVRLEVLSAERARPLQFEIPVVWHGTSIRPAEITGLSSDVPTNGTRADKLGL